MSAPAAAPAPSYNVTVPSLGSPGATSTFTATPGQSQAILSAASQYNVDPNILFYISAQESGIGQNNYNARSGASGPFQFLPSTIAGFANDPNSPNYGMVAGQAPGQFNPFDFTQEARLAAYYIKVLLAGNGNNVQQALLSYSGNNAPYAAGFASPLTAISPIGTVQIPHQTANGVGAGAGSVYSLPILGGILTAGAAAGNAVSGAGTAPITPSTPVVGGVESAFGQFGGGNQVGNVVTAVPNFLGWVQGNFTKVGILIGLFLVGLLVFNNLLRQHGGGVNVMEAAAA